MAQALAIIFARRLIDSLQDFGKRCGWLTFSPTTERLSRKIIANANSTAGLRRTGMPAAEAGHFERWRLAGRFVQTTAKNRENIAARNDADDLRRLGAVQNRQAADVVPNHVIGRLSNRAIVVDEFRQACNQILEQLLFSHLRIQQIAPREHAHEYAVGIDDGKTLVAGVRPVGGDPATHLRHRLRGGKGDDFARRDFPNRNLRK